MGTVPTLFIIKELRNKVSSSVGRGHHQHQLFSNNCVEMETRKDISCFPFSYFHGPDMQRQRQLSIRIYVPCCQSHSVSLRGGQLFPIVQLMTPHRLLLPIHPPSPPSSPSPSSPPLSPPQLSFSLHNSFSKPNLFLSQLATTLAATTRTAR